MTSENSGSFEPSISCNDFTCCVNDDKIYVYCMRKWIWLIQQGNIQKDITTNIFKIPSLAGSFIVSKHFWNGTVITIIIIICVYVSILNLSVHALIN